MVTRNVHKEKTCEISLCISPHGEYCGSIKRQLFCSIQFFDLSMALPNISVSRLASGDFNVVCHFPFSFLKFICEIDLGSTGCTNSARYCPGASLNSYTLYTHFPFLDTMLLEKRKFTVVEKFVSIKIQLFVFFLAYLVIVN
jgi:hypothetical protein